jgi:hypothetical protein
MAYTATGLAFQAGNETTYGTAVTPTVALNITGGSIGVKPTRISEANYFASKAKTSSDLVTVKVDGSLDYVLRPEFAGWLVKWALGGTDTVTVSDPVAGANKHTILLQDAVNQLPAKTLVIDRKNVVSKYSGCKIDSFSLEGAAGDVIKGSIGIKAKDEASGVTASLAALSLKNYKLNTASVTIGGTVFSVKSFKMNIKNNLQEAPQNTSSGLYLPEPVHGLRDISFEVSTEYATAVETLRAASEATDVLVSSLVITFQSASMITGATPYKLTITANNLALDDVSDPIGSPYSIMMSTLSMSACAIGSTEPLQIQVWDNVATAY